jgi:hypothetical protein
LGYGARCHDGDKVRAWLMVICAIVEKILFRGQDWKKALIRVASEDPINVGDAVRHSPIFAPPYCT